MRLLKCTGRLKKKEANSISRNEKNKNIDFRNSTDKVNMRLNMTEERLVIKTK